MTKKEISELMALELEDVQEYSTRSTARDTVMKNALYNSLLEAGVPMSSITYNPQASHWPVGKTNIKTLDVTAALTSLLEARGLWSSFAKNITNNFENLLGEGAALHILHPTYTIGAMRVGLLYDTAKDSKGKRLDIRSMVNGTVFLGDHFWDEVSLYLIDNSAPYWHVVTSSELGKIDPSLSTSTLERYEYLTTDFAQRYLYSFRCKNPTQYRVMMGEK